MFQFLGQRIVSQRSTCDQKDSGDREGEVSDCGNLGTLFRSLGNCFSADE